MKRSHPNEIELQQYACCRFTGQIESHLASCSLCRGKVELYREIDERLYKLSDDVVAEDFSDRVMRVIAGNNASAEKPQFTSKRTADSDSAVARTWKMIWRPEMTNVCFAIVATYMFVHTGILQEIIGLDPVQLENGMRSKIEIVVDMLDGWNDRSR